MIEEEEKIINYLEDIDFTFSAINRRLKEILFKIIEINKVNKKVSKDFEPLIKMFGPKERSKVDVNCSLSINPQSSSIILETSTPKNPFIDTGSSDLLNKTILNKFDESVKLTSSSLLEDCKYSNSNAFYEESSSSELKEFDIEMIPEVFRNEESLNDVYKFIVERRSVSFEELIDRFSSVDSEKIVIFLDLLKNKKFIRRKKNVFFIAEEM